MEYSTLRFTVENPSSINDLGLEFWLNDTKFFDNTIGTGQHNIIHTFDSKTSGQHLLRIVLKNKTVDHTLIDDQCKIIQDAVLKIHNIYLDDILLDQVFNELAIYKHDFNGTGHWSDHPFYGLMGCNGIVELAFETPFYLWLLENTHYHKY